MRGKKKGTGQAVPERMGLIHLFLLRVSLFLLVVKGELCRRKNARTCKS